MHRIVLILGAAAVLGCVPPPPTPPVATLGTADFIWVERPMLLPGSGLGGLEQARAIFACYRAATEGVPTCYLARFEGDPADLHWPPPGLVPTKRARPHRQKPPAKTAPGALQ